MGMALLGCENYFLYIYDAEYFILYFFSHSTSFLYKEIEYLRVFLPLLFISH